MEEEKETKRKRTNDQDDISKKNHVEPVLTTEMAEETKEDEQKEGALDGNQEEKEEEEEEEPASVIVQFCDMEGNSTGPNIDIPTESTPEQMEELVNQLVQNEGEKVPYSFYLGDTEVMESLSKSITEQKLSTEAVLKVTYQPLAVFRVRPVSRCTDTMVGHTEAVLHVSFSPDGKRLASGGGDFAVRFWNVNTCLPKNTLRGHKHHVLCTSWSPDAKRFASADKKGEIRLWDPSSAEPVGKPIKAHKQWITSLAWEPLHRRSPSERLASSSKDSLVKIWNARTGRCEISLSGHSDSVECVKWGGEGLLYTASRDRTIKVWAVEDGGKLVRTLVGHGHRVNSLALSTDYVCRTGPFDHRCLRFTSEEDMAESARERYESFKATQPGPERLVSGSDDFTLFYWSPTEKKQPLSRLTGHQQAVNHIAFSPDGRYFASASFDKKVKLWDGRTGRFMATLTGHVGSVYQLAWSADSRLLVTASKDSTVKLWEVRQPKKAKATLPGHADEVYALDWSPNGSMVASGSKDRTIKIWKS